MSKYEQAERKIVYFMLKSPEIIKMYDKKVTYMPTREYRLLAREISAYYHEYNYINEADFIDYIEKDTNLTETINKVNKNINTEDYTLEEINDYINVIKEYNVNNAIKRMQNKMHEIADPLKKAELAQKIIDLKNPLISDTA